MPVNVRRSLVFYEPLGAAALGGVRMQSRTAYLGRVTTGVDSKLVMNAEAQETDRAAVAIVAGIINTLQVDRKE
jgi:hypothetical protein